MERIRGCVGAIVARLGTWVKKQAGEMTLRRALAVVVTLSLWMGTGGMTASVKMPSPSGEVFGEVHWYEGG